MICLNSKKNLFSSLLLELVLSRAVLRRERNLLPPLRASQYSTPTAATASGRGPSVYTVNLQDQRYIAANELRADEHAVKPHDIRHSRTSSAVSGDPLRSVHNNQGAGRGFFQNSPPPDGPRPPRTTAEPLPAAGVHAPDNGTIAAAFALCPARWSDTAGSHAAVTTAAPPPRKPCYSTAKEDAAERTTSRIPSTDKSAYDNGSGLAMGSKSNHAGSRTFASVNSRRSSPGSGASLLLMLCSGTFWTAHILLVQHLSSLITSLPFFQPLRDSLPPGP
jgi:hypothetical protein